MNKFLDHKRLLNFLPTFLTNFFSDFDFYSKINNYFRYFNTHDHDDHYRYTYDRYKILVGIVHHLMLISHGVEIYSWHNNFFYDGILQPTLVRFIYSVGNGFGIAKMYQTFLQYF